MTLKEAIELDDTEIVEKIIIEMLKKDPKNVDLWFRLCMTEISIPFVDHIAAFNCIDKIHEIEPQNIMATILKAVIESIHLVISDDTYNKLSKIDNLPKEMMAIVFYLQALYFENKSDRIYLMEYYLIKSISEYDRYPYILEKLAMFNYCNGKYSIAVELLKKSLSCVLYILDQNDNYEELRDFTDYQNYIDELITGVTVTYACYGFIEENLELAEKALGAHIDHTTF